MKKWHNIFKNLAFVCILIIIILSRCANSSSSPTGGPRDTIPPILLGMQPDNRTSNFNDKNLIFTYNEYVHLKDQQKEFTISPVPEKKPELRLRGRSVIVHFPAQLDSNTTYSVDFGNSVVDLNEDNPAEQLNFIFSTGKVLDTLVYAGRLLDALSLEPVAGAFVFFYEENLDTIPLKKNPSALARADKDGVFLAKGLKNKPYKAVSVLDANANLRYDRVAEKIAFSDTLIQPLRLGQHDSIAFADLPVFHLFTEINNRQSLLDYKRLEQRLVQLIFSAPHPIIESLEFEGLEQKKIVQDNNLTGDTIKYWFTHKSLPDTIKSTLVYSKTDTLDQLSPDTMQLKLIVEKKKEEKSSRKTKDDEEEEDDPVLEPSIELTSTQILEHSIPVSFKTPLANSMASRIRLMKFDDEGNDKIPIKIKLERDSSELRQFYLKAAWEQSSKYELTLLPGAFIDIYRITNDTIVKTFETANPEKYGSIEVELQHATKQYIVQIMKDKNVIVQKIITPTAPIVFSYIESGKYKMRIIEDNNANGRWDTGDYLSKRHAEKVWFLTFSDGDDLINVRPNWELKKIIDVEQLH